MSNRPPLARAYSKDQLYNDGMRQNKYAGAGSIVEAGRVESQRLLMERYRRLDVADTDSTKVGSAMKPKFISGGGYAAQ